MFLRLVVKKIYDRAGLSGAREIEGNTKIMQMSCERDDAIGRRREKAARYLRGFYLA